jgi:MFS family permease
VNLIADSFAWPFRGDWRSRWAVGVVVVLLLPLLFIPLLGYAIDATHAAEHDPSQGPPPWRLDRRLLADGLWVTFAILLTAAPFLIALSPLSNLLFDAHVWSSSDPTLAQLDAHVLAILLLALPWGLLLLLVMPHAIARFAATRRPGDLFNFAASVQGVTDQFATWNVVAAAIVTAWAVGVACAGLLCVGLVPGIFYAILVSAHATAALHDPGTNPPTR